MSDDPVIIVCSKLRRTAARVVSSGCELFWGDLWKAVVPHGADNKGYAGHNRKLTEIYRRTNHVDVNRLYPLDIVPMHVRYFGHQRTVAGTVQHWRTCSG